MPRSSGSSQDRVSSVGAARIIAVQEQVDSVAQAVEELMVESKKIEELRLKLEEYQKKIVESEDKFEEKISHFYTVFGILFAIFAIGGFAGSNYTTEALFSLWSLALGAVCCYLFVTEFRKSFSDPGASRWRAILGCSSLFIIALVLLIGSILALNHSAGSDRADKESQKQSEAANTARLNELEDKVNLINASLLDTRDDVESVRGDLITLFKRK